MNQTRPDKYCIIIAMDKQNNLYVIPPNVVLLASLTIIQTKNTLPRGQHTKYAHVCWNPGTKFYKEEYEAKEENLETKLVEAYYSGKHDETANAKLAKLVELDKCYEQAVFNERVTL